jgi:hypothetical protein
MEYRERAAPSAPRESCLAGTRAWKARSFTAAHAASWSFLHEHFCPEIEFFRNLFSRANFDLVENRFIRLGCLHPLVILYRKRTSGAEAKFHLSNDGTSELVPFPKADVLQIKSRPQTKPSSISQNQPSPAELC